MAKSYKNTRAQLISEEDKIEQRISTIGVHPLKLAFVIDGNWTLTELLKLIEYNSIIWGGIYSLFLPTNGKTLRDDWAESLCNYDPDIIFICGAVSSGLVETLDKLVQPFHIWKWSDEALKEDNLRHKDIYDCIRMFYPLIDFYEKNRSNSRPDISVPDIVINHSLTTYGAAQFGIYPEIYRKYCLQTFYTNFVGLESEELTEYLKFVSRLNGKLTPIYLTKHKLAAHTFSGYSKFTLVFSDIRSTEDFCLFWNLRATSSFMAKGVYIFPIGLLSKPKNLKAFADWCNNNVTGTNHIVIASASLSKQRLQRLRDRMQSHIKKEIEFIDIWFTDFVTSSIRPIEAEYNEELRLHNYEFRFKAPTPRFSQRIRDGQWVIDIGLGELKFVSPDFVPPKYSGINKLLSGELPQWVINMNGYPARLANGRLSYRAQENTVFISAKLPNNYELFNSLLKSKKINYTLTDKCRYAQGIIGILGGLDESSFLRDSNVRRLLKAMSDGSAYSPREMLGILKPGAKSSREKTFSLISKLALKRILLRGYKIQCPICDLTRWYAPDEVSESMQCAGCLSNLQPSIEAPLRYRLNELMIRGIEQGSIPVLLTLFFLKKLCQSSFMFLPGVEAKMRNAVDVDILGSCDGHVVVSECKDLQVGDVNNTPKSIIPQLEKVIDLAKRLNASTVFLSILAQEVPDNIEKQIIHLNKELKNSMAVHLITGAELEKGFRTKLTKIGGKIREEECNINDFLPERPKRKSGWIRNPGKRTSSF